VAVAVTRAAAAGKAVPAVAVMMSLVTRTHLTTRRIAGSSIIIRIRIQIAILPHHHHHLM
jgi:hypothetical protein